MFQLSPYGMKDMVRMSLELIESAGKANLVPWGEEVLFSLHHRRDFCCTASKESLCSVAVLQSDHTLHLFCYLCIYLTTPVCQAWVPAWVQGQQKQVPPCLCQVSGQICRGWERCSAIQAITISPVSHLHESNGPKQPSHTAIQHA